MSNNESKLSLLEALSMAGGAAKTAKLGHARLIRKVDHSETQISLGDIQKGKQPDFAMAPGRYPLRPIQLCEESGHHQLRAALRAPRQLLRFILRHRIDLSGLPSRIADSCSLRPKVVSSRVVGIPETGRHGVTAI